MTGHYAPRTLPLLGCHRDAYSQTRSLDSHHHLRHWLPLRDLIAYSFQEPRETFMVPVPMRLARCFFCRLLPFSCSFKVIGEHYSAAGQDQLIFFEDNDRTY